MKKGLSGSGLSRDDSGALKGIAVCLLLFHHLFYLRESLARPELRFLLLDPDRIRMIAVFAKICVPLFVFVTAYGLAIK